MAISKALFNTKERKLIMQCLTSINLDYFSPKGVGIANIKIISPIKDATSSVADFFYHNITNSTR